MTDSHNPANALEPIKPSKLVEGVAFLYEGKPAIVRNGAIFMALHPSSDESGVLERGTGNIALGWKIISVYNSAASWLNRGFSRAGVGVEALRIYDAVQALPEGVEAPDHKAWSDFFHEVYSNS